MYITTAYGHIVASVLQFEYYDVTEVCFHFTELVGEVLHEPRKSTNNFGKRPFNITENVFVLFFFVFFYIGLGACLRSTECYSSTTMASFTTRIRGRIFTLCVNIIILIIINL